jgi:hypothetical protein
MEINTSILPAKSLSPIASNATRPVLKHTFQRKTLNISYNYFQDMQKFHIMMGGTIKIFLAIPVPSILQLLLPDVVKEHLSCFPYGPGTERRKTMYVQ